MIEVIVKMECSFCAEKEYYTGSYESEGFKYLKSAGWDYHRGKEVTSCPNCSEKIETLTKKED